MLRITSVPSEDTVARLRVEGRLTQRTAGALLASSQAALTGRRTLLLDLAGVTFADTTGIGTLKEVARQRAVLIGGSSFLDEMLHDEATGRRPGHAAEANDDSSEAALVARLRRGDDEAFEEVVRLYGARLLATARRFLNSEHDAQDAVQEAFLSAFKAIGEFSGDSKLSTWLHRIVVNAALMKLRRRRRRPEESIDDLLPRFDEEGGWADAPNAWDSASDMLLERRETRAMVRRCIERLPESHRTVLLLRDIEDLDTDEAAAILGITPNAVKIRLHRARQALRTLLERELGQPGYGRPAPPAVLEAASD